MDELNQNESLNNEGKSKAFYITLTIILFILGLVLGYFLRGYMVGEQDQVVEKESSQVNVEDNSSELGDWKTYVNDKGFKIKYPSSGWSIRMKSGGGTTQATSQTQSFNIVKDRDIVGASFNVSALGSSKLGSYYSSAENLSQYLDLLPKTEGDGNIIRKFVKKTSVDGQEAHWYEVYDWSIEKQAMTWSPEVYWQYEDDIYVVRFNSTYNETAKKILSTFEFVK